MTPPPFKPRSTRFRKARAFLVGERLWAERVMFPTGTFDTIAPLRVPSGVHLFGNAWGTTLRNLSPDANSAVIQFVGNTGTGLNIGAGVVNFGINMTNAAAIRVHSSVTNALVDVHIANLAIDSEHVGIDLRNVRLYHARSTPSFSAIPEGNSVWIGDPYSGDNQVAGLQVTGNVVGATEPEKAHVVLYGETTLETFVDRTQRHWRTADIHLRRCND